jgi:hypothetical protein
MLVIVSRMLPRMGKRVGLTVTFLDNTTSTANGDSTMLKPFETRSREYVPIFWNEGVTQPIENADKSIDGTEKKLKLHIGLKSIGDTDATVIIMPPSI